MDAALARRSGRMVLAGVVLGAASGVAYVLIVAPFGLAPLLRGATAGALIAGGIGAIEVFGVASAIGRRMRRLPFAAFIAAKTTLWLTWIVPVLLVIRIVAPYPDALQPTAIGADVAYSLAISLALVALLELDRLLGRHVLWRLVTGRYHRPVIEDRAFLLLDLEGSSAIAETIGDERFLALHAGSIAIGEVGDVRREIMFLGDTLNTAARIEQECRRLGRRALISGDLLARLAPPAGMRVGALGDVMLRGKGRAVALHAIEFD